jgi:hypothetical protein
LSELSTPSSLPFRTHPKPGRAEEGDDIDVLARDFELDVAKVQQALRWEQRAARAA